jgi:hypothetical protein
MVIGTLDRIEEGTLIILTHTQPVYTIHLPAGLFPEMDEGDLVEIAIEKDPELAQEQRERLVRVREREIVVEL